ncbi:hypothetical protein [Nostocoides vanveenii]|uniref:Uncharacterized protein n=1 Tax=Nostocoides vanveenii TaxID=330835 RepID=A0ABN2KDV3_9MICO
MPAWVEDGVTPHPTGGYVRVITNDHNTLYLDADGKSHRLDGPAITRQDRGSAGWWKHGRPHRFDGPAVVRENGSSEWWLEGAPMSEAAHTAIVERLRATGEAP